MEKLARFSSVSGGFSDGWALKAEACGLMSFATRLRPAAGPMGFRREDHMALFFADRRVAGQGQFFC
jgi:hypothetical protein